MAAMLVVLARCVLLLTLMAAPWAIGGADLPEQQWLFAGVLAAGVLAWLGSTLNGTARFSPVANIILLLAAALIAIGAIQLAPHPHEPSFQHAQLTGTLRVLDGDDTPASARSLYPAATRLQMARLAAALCAFLCGAWVFRERSARCALWAGLALNGVALVGFGLIQRGSWNGKLYWTIPLELGGQPFAAFVNRNNAAEYLSLCLAGALGLWGTRRAATEGPSPAAAALARVQQSAGFWDRIPASTWSVLVLLLYGGVLATLSRAGALSATIAIVLVGIWASVGGRARTLLLPLLGIVIAAGIWIGVSQQRTALQERLNTLTKSAANDGRLAHWTDMIGAVRDFPAIGTGLGSYRYANKPYESRASESWFESADNQYLELIVDGGLGAGAIALLLLMTGAGLAIAWRSAGYPGEALACGYPLVALALQSVTDCWWNTSANVLTLAAMAGALSSPERRAQSLSSLERIDQLLDSRRGLPAAALIGLCVVAGTALGLFEVTAAAKSSLFRRQLPEDEQRPALTPLELDGLIGTGEQLLRERRDDAELHAALARLYYLRFRLQAAETLDTIAPDKWTEASKWDRTSPTALFGTLARYVQIGDESSLERFRSAPAVAENLLPMSEHVRAARGSCPVLPFCGLYEAIAARLDGGDVSLPLRREAALSPARTRLLHSLARSAEMIGDDGLFNASLKRCLEIDPDRTLDYVSTARRRTSEPAIVEQLLPAKAGPLLDFAEAAQSPLGRAKAIERATIVTSDASVTESERSYALGRIAWLSGDLAAATQHLRATVTAVPHDARRRWHYARALQANGQTDEARKQLQIARQLARNDRRLKSQLDELERTVNPDE